MSCVFFQQDSTSMGGCELRITLYSQFGFAEYDSYATNSFDTVLKHTNKAQF